MSKSKGKSSKSKTRAGKAVESEISRSLKAFGADNVFWYRRIQDFNDWVAYNTKLRKAKVPGDFEALYRGIYFLLEVKSTRGERFNMKWLRVHQRENLEEVEKCGGRGYIIFSKRGRPVKASAIRINDYMALETEYKTKGRKSIPAIKMLEAGITLPRLRRSFNMAPIFLIEPQKEKLRGVSLKDD